MNYYNNIAKGYEELHKEEQLKKLKAIKKYLRINPEDKLLDVGCGTGLTTSCWNCKCYGIDPSKKLLEIAKKKYKNQKIGSCKICKEPTSSEICNACKLLQKIKQ